MQEAPIPLDEERRNALLHSLGVLQQVDSAASNFRLVLPRCAGG